jgi:CSLREA domain-containing protein
VSAPFARRTAALALVATIANAAVGGATNYSITALADTVAADGVCSLREAIRAAASDLAVHDCPPGGSEDSIQLESAGTYLFDQGHEAIGAGRLRIAGIGADATFVDMDSQNRFLRLGFGAEVVLERLTLERGSSLATLPSIGGAIQGESGSSLVMRDAAVSRCSAVFGGAIGGLSLSLRLERVEFLENEALGIADAPNAQGGALALSNFGAVSVLLEEVRFRRNRASSTFVGAVVQGGAVSLSASAVGPERASLTMRYASFENNEVQATNSYSPGLIVAAGQAADARIEDSRFESHRNLGAPGSADGAGLTVRASGDGTAAVRRVELVGGASLVGSAQLFAAATGGSIVVDGVLARDATVTGVQLAAGAEASLVAGQLTVSGNSPEGVRAEQIGTGTLRIENSILWNNGPIGQPDVDLATEGAVDADRVANRNWIGDLGDPDPLFADPGNGDYSLQPASGPRNAGEAAFASVGPFDLRHAPRVVDGELDLGALELEGLFADAFEAGSTVAWSDAAP